MTIASTIYQQLGGNRFMAMVGGKDLLNGKNYLQFDIGHGAKNKATRVIVELQSNDLYNVRFYRWKMIDKGFGKLPDLFLIESISDVVVENLVSIFKNRTGMEVRIG